MIQQYKTLTEDRGKGLTARKENGHQEIDEEMNKLQTEYNQIYVSDIANAYK